MTVCIMIKMIELAHLTNCAGDPFSCVSFTFFDFSPWQFFDLNLVL